jgi:SAM-dependent methyltransferase
VSDEVAWCEIENGEYEADLDLWLGLCSSEPPEDSPAPTYGAKSVLELGAGVGRVSLELAALGAQVWALDTERELLDEIVRRGRARGIGAITPICADARSYTSGGRSFDLVVAPQVLVQTFEGRADRVAIMACASRHLAPIEGSSFWMTFQPDLDQAWGNEEDTPLPPRVTEIDGRRFETEALESYWHHNGGERSLRIVWSRRADGRETTAQTSYAELSQSELEDEASEAGLKLADSIPLPASGYFLDQVALRFIAGGR